VVITVLLFWRHRSNILNLLSGKEGRIAGKPGSTDSD
jgi:glycerol-3-phosphate acyltransferase PlsY